MFCLDELSTGGNCTDDSNCTTPMICCSTGKCTDQNLCTGKLTFQPTVITTIDPGYETLLLTQTVAKGLMVVPISEFYADSESVDLKRVSGRNDQEIIILLEVESEFFFPKYQ